MSDNASADAAAATAASDAATSNMVMNTTTTTTTTTFLAEVPVAVAVVDADILCPSSSSSSFSSSSSSSSSSDDTPQDPIFMVMDPETTTAPTSMRRDTTTTTTATTTTTTNRTPKRVAVAVPINSITPTAPTTTARRSTQRSQHNRRNRNNDTQDCNNPCAWTSFFIAMFIMITVGTVLLIRDKSSSDWYSTNGPPTNTIYFDSFEAFCFTVMGFYALEQPWLNCRCDHDYRWIVCQGTRPSQDYSFTSLDSTTLNNADEDDTTTTTSTNTTVLPDPDAPMTVLMIHGTHPTGYTGTSCECETQSCDHETIQCFEVSSYDYSSSCRITNNVTWGESICNVFKVEQDLFGNEYSYFHEACQLCGGLPQTDGATDSDSGYYYYDTSDCGSDFNHGNNSSSNNNNNLDQRPCVPSLIPKPEWLYGAMSSAAHHTPNPKLLNNMQTSTRFCNYMTNKYENGIGGYTCTCTEEEDNIYNNPEENFYYVEGDVISTVDCRQPVNDTTTVNYIKWQRQYLPNGVYSFGAFNDDAYTWGIAPLTYPFLLLGESCQCSEPTCTVSPVLCTALSYNFETYGCSVYDKLNTDGTSLCGSQECSICELSPGDEDTGVVRVNTSSCNYGQQQGTCSPTAFFL